MARPRRIVADVPVIDEQALRLSAARRAFVVCGGTGQGYSDAWWSRWSDRRRAQWGANDPAAERALYVAALERLPHGLEVLADWEARYLRMAKLRAGAQ